MNVDEKIETFKKDGLDKLQIITDFDMTLTKGFNSNGTIASNSISVLRKEGYLSEEYVKESNKLADHYFPIEHDYSIPLEERSKIIVNWWKEHYQILSKYGMTKDVLKDIVENKKVQLREKFEELFNLINSNNIPILIFSAGVGEIIKLYLESLNLKEENVHLISNVHKYDSQGKFIGIEGEIIHSLNKNMTPVHDFPYYVTVKDRKNIILIGDSIGDLKMSEGFKYDNRLTIGFLNKRPNDEGYEKAKLDYNKEFDIVLEGDPSLEPVIDVLKKII